MIDLVEAISRADAADLEEILQAVLARYAQLYPDWEVSTVSFQKSVDRNTEIDRFIELLTKMKTPPAGDAS